MMEQVKRTIERYSMLETGDRVIVAVSGGADSLSLLHLFLRLKSEYSLKIFVAHVDHMTRGGGSTEDAKFVGGLCKEWGIPLYIKEADMEQYAILNSLSEEEAGREIRYKFFYDLKQKLDADRIAIAHNKNDQAETVIMRMLRGTGIKGLAGIEPVRQPGIIRPLIDVDRDEIEKYCSENGLNYRRDYTNYQRLYTRNKIRLELMPYIEKEFNPNIVDTLARLSQTLREEDQYIEQQTFKVFTQIAQVNSRQTCVEIDIFEFKKQHVAVKKRLIRWAIKRLKGHLMGINYIHIEDAIQLARSSQSGKRIDLPGGISISRSFNKLVIGKAQCYMDGVKDFEYHLVIPGSTYISEIHGEVVANIINKSDFIENKKNSYKAALDLDKLSREKYIVMRNRRPGDYILFDGMKGKKKIKKYFIEKKIPAYQRANIPMLASGNQIIWIPGKVINKDFKVDTNTIKILVLEYNNK